jgi:hypothetical protein
LKSEIIKDKEIKQILSAPQEYIESSEYFSWERFFTKLLVEKTQDSYLRYAKKELNKNYLENGYPEKICAVMKEISLL